MRRAGGLVLLQLEGEADHKPEGFGFIDCIPTSCHTTSPVVISHPCFTDLAAGKLLCRQCPIGCTQPSSPSCALRQVRHGAAAASSSNKKLTTSCSTHVHILPPIRYVQVGSTDMCFIQRYVNYEEEAFTSRSFFPHGTFCGQCWTYM